MNKFKGTFPQQLRTAAATNKPAPFLYREKKTLHKEISGGGGLTEFAAGDRARLVRQDKVTGKQREYDLKIARLIKRGDTSANVRLEPGDVIIIPESMF